MRNPESETNMPPLRFHYDRRLKLETSRISDHPTLGCLLTANLMMPLT
jgi:hypothetical protein